MQEQQPQRFQLLQQPPQRHKKFIIPDNSPRMPPYSSVKNAGLLSFFQKQHPSLLKHPTFECAKGECFGVMRPGWVLAEEALHHKHCRLCARNGAYYHCRSTLTEPSLARAPWHEFYGRLLSLRSCSGQVALKGNMSKRRHNSQKPATLAKKVAKPARVHNSEQE
eukprot:5111871-Amphidinium_carterae.1